MNLFRETGSLIRWLSALVFTFLRKKPMTTAVILCASALSRVTTVLAFVLPLKVILMVASEGMPRYFEGFVPPEYKDGLVIVLVVAAVLSVFATILLDVLKSRLAATSSADVVGGANRLTLYGDQHSEAQSVYERSCDVVSGVIFSFVGLAVVGFLQPLLVSVLAGAFLVEYVVVAGIMARLDPVHPRGVSGAIKKEPKGLLQGLSAANFLIAFAVLLYPFVWGGGGDVLVALICVIVLRRVLNPLAQIIVDASKLFEKRATINALVYRHHQQQHIEDNRSRSIRQVFGKQARQQRAAEIMESVGLSADGLEVSWQDPAVPGIATLLIKTNGKEGTQQLYQQQIYAKNQRYRLANEAVLFEHVGREQLGAPAQVARFIEGPFECQIVAAGSGQPVPEKQWPGIRHALFERMLAVKPASDLVSAYTVSKPLLADRLSDGLVRRLEMAVDSDKDEVLLRRLMESLPEIRRILRCVPLYVYNSEARPNNVLLAKDDSPLLMTWGQWSLEPVGAGLPPYILNSGMGDIVEKVRDYRADVGETTGVEHYRLAGLCWSLEWHITRNMFRSAMLTVGRILDNSVVVQSEAEAIKPAQAAAGNLY